MVDPKRVLLVCASVCLLGGAVLPAPRASAHCQVPCGIYGDELKFQELKQHVETIAKAMHAIHELAGKDDPQSSQQLARWVANKESHATKIQVEAQEYFLAQRIKFPKDKADEPKYFAQLAALHQMIVYAMKCKQTVDPEQAEALSGAIGELERLYFGPKEAAHLKHHHAEGHGHGHDHAAHGHEHAQDAAKPTR